MGAFEVDLILATVLGINLLLFLGQTAACDINTACNVFYDTSKNILNTYDAGNNTLDESVINNLPSGEGSVSPTTGNLFTDSPSVLKTWLLNIPGVNILLGVINAVPNLLKGMGLPNYFVFAVGAFWYGLTLFLIVAWIFGKGT